MNPKIVGARIAELRKEKDMTQQQLADKLLVSNKAVSKWETGVGLPDIAMIPTLAEILGVSTDYILNENSTNNDDKIKAKPQYKKYAIVISIIGILLFSTIISFTLNNQSEQTSIDDLNATGFMVVQASYIPWEMPWVTTGEITNGVVPASEFNPKLTVEYAVGKVFTVSILGDPTPIIYEIPLITSDDIIPFNTDKRTVVTDSVLIYVINDSIDYLTDGAMRLNREIVIYDINNIMIWIGTINTWIEGDFRDPTNSGFTNSSYVSDRNDFYELEVWGMEIRNDDTIPAIMIPSFTLNIEKDMPFTGTINLGL